MYVRGSVSNEEVKSGYTIYSICRYYCIEDKRKEENRSLHVQ
jgi:hypothetical protein